MGLKFKWKPPKFEDVVKVLTDAEKLAAALETAAAVVADESDDPMDPHVKLYHLYETASSKLEERTVISEPVQTNSPDDQVTSEGTLVGCWINPTTATGNFAANQDLYKDLAAFLTLSGVPAKFEHGAEGKFEDTASLLAQVAFASPPPSSANTDANTAIKDTFLIIPNLNKDCIIQVKNASYNLPLGDKVPTTAWHAGLQVKTTMTRKFKQAQLAKLPKGGIALPTADSGDWKWATTFQVDWANASTAEDAGREIPARFLKQNPDYAITLTSVIGITLSIQIAAPRSVTPADIEAKLRATVADFAAAGRGDFLVMPRVQAVCSILL